MQVGFNLLLWTTRAGREHRPLFERIKAAGYDGVEVPVFEGAPEDYRALGDVLDEVGLDRTTITVIPTADANPIGNDAERAQSVDYLSWAIDCSAALGSKVLCGPLHSTLGRFSGAGPTAEERRRCLAVHRAVGDRASGQGVVVALEAINRFECYFMNTMAALDDYLAELDHPAFQAMFDTFHANIEEKDPVAAATRCGRRLAHVHLSENDRGVLGSGHVPLAATLAALAGDGYDGWLTIEAFGRALPELAAATRVWRDFDPVADAVWLEGAATVRAAWPSWAGGAT